MSESLLRCEGIQKSYRLGRTTLSVLRGVDLGFRRGRFIAVVGSSGSGKSTLMHVLSGLDVPQRGQVYFEGRPIFEPEGLRKIPAGRDAGMGMTISPAARIPRRAGFQHHGMMEERRNELLNARFGFVFQFYHLLPEFDVVENVMLPSMVGQSVAGWLAGRAIQADRALQLLEKVGLGDRLRHRPNELSGGERQRVAIARALMNEPEVLFADEPTGNLDAKTGRDVFQLLRTLNQGGQTIIMVTHDRDLAKEADEVVRLLDGRVE